MNLSFLSPSATILALHWDGITTTGVVYRRAKGMPEAMGRAVARSVDPAAALTTILAELRAAGVKPPKKVILACDRAVLTRAELPVHPDRPRPYEQMRELARWETEMAFSDLPSWNVENVLHVMGAVEDFNDQRIRAAMQNEAEQVLSGPAARYQDVALQLGLIDKSTRDLAVEFRELLNQPVSDSGCGWTPIPQAEKDEFAQHHWLLAALSDHDRRAWRGACKSAKLDLVGILPSWGLSDLMASQLPVDPVDTSDGTARLLIERHSGAIALFNINGPAVENIRIINLNRADTDEREVLQRVLGGRAAPRAMSIGFDREGVREIRRALPNVQVIEDLVEGILSGAAARGLAMKEAPDWPPLIERDEPAPPIWKSENFYRAAVIALVVLGIAVVDLGTRWKKKGFVDELAALEADYEKRMAVANQIKSNVREANGLTGRVEDMKAEISELKARAQLMNYLQSRRQQVVENLLDALQRAIPQGVVVRAIEESHKVPEVFTLTAWALTDIEAENFIATLNKTLAPSGLVVADESVFKEVGPQQVDGYGARLRIVPLSQKTTEDQELHGQ